MEIQIVEPKHLKYLLIAIALAYLVFSRDLIPDFAGRGLGLIDDVLLIAGLRYFYRKRLLNAGAGATGGSAKAGAGAFHQQAQQSEQAFDPYQVLGLPASSSREAIKSAYRARMTEYHPDKVSHLGKELQELAHQKVLEIQRAYRELTK